MLDFGAFHIFFLCIFIVLAFDLVISDASFKGVNDKTQSQKEDRGKETFIEHIIGSDLCEGFYWHYLK